MTAPQLVLSWVKAAAPLTVMKAVIKLIVLSGVSFLLDSFCSLHLQLFLTGRRWGLTPPWRVYLVRGRHQAHPGWGNAERQMRWNLSHPWEPVTEGLLRLLRSVSLCLTLWGLKAFSHLWFVYAGPNHSSLYTCSFSPWFGLFSHREEYKWTKMRHYQLHENVQSAHFLSSNLHPTPGIVR